MVECGDTIAAAYAGRLLVDLGADVILVEDLGGHPLRAVGPYLGGNPGCDRSAGFAYVAAGKQAICLDVTASAATATRLARLVAGADVVIRSTRDGRDWIGDDLLAAATAHPGLIVVDVSTFGRQDGVVPSQQRPAGAGRRRAAVGQRHGAERSVIHPLRYRGELASVHAG